MEVIVQSLLQNEAGKGQSTLAVSLDQTVESLIVRFCEEKGIPPRKEYIIRNHNNDIIHNSRLLGICGLKDGELLYLDSLGGYTLKNLFRPKKKVVCFL